MVQQEEWIIFLLVEFLRYFIEIYKNLQIYYWMKVTVRKLQILDLASLKA